MSKPITLNVLIEPYVLEDLLRTRRKAIKKNGNRDVSDLLWLAVESEETGEAAKAILEGDAGDAYEECLQAAAVFLFHAEMLRERGLRQ